MKSPSGMIFFYHPNEKKNVIEIESKPLVLCKECKLNADNGGLYPDGRTRCPIQETYALLMDGYCHLGERVND